MTQTKTRRGVYVRDPHHVIGSTIYVPRKHMAAPPPEPAPRPRTPPFVAWTVPVLVMAMIGAGGATAAAFFTPVLEIDRVTVQGVAMLPEEAILNRVDLLGENQLTVSFDATEAAIARLPLVESVEIRRAWPRGIVVLIRERQPWGTWEQNGVAYPIDDEGVVLVAVDPPKGGPVIRSSATTTLIPGERVNPEAIAAVVEIMERLPATLGTSVAEVAFVPAKGVQVTTGDGRVAILGNSTGIAYKLAVWAATDAKAIEERIHYTVIDLTFGNRPVLQ
jgi:cell division protein FtsQ